MLHRARTFIVLAVTVALLFGIADIQQTKADIDVDNIAGTDSEGTVNVDLGAGAEGSRTSSDSLDLEEQAIQLDGMSVAEMKMMRDAAETHVFQAEVNRMMKLIINSLYQNKEIFLRELISNASDALDKIRLMSLTDNQILHATSDMNIKIKADKDNNALHITDTGIGMTHDELVKNLGTIAKSGTSEFLEKLGESAPSDLNDLIGQFGVGFYSAFLVANKVIVTSKSNNDEQYIWESDSNSFSIVKDPRGNTLPRGTTISLFLKEEAKSFLEQATLRKLVERYSQFINFDIFLWTSKTEQVEVEDEVIEDDAEKDEKEDEDADVADEKKEDKKEKKTVEKTIWDWELINDVKPIWLRKPAEVEKEEYNKFYKSISKDYDEPLSYTHFNAEGEVTFRTILYVPKRSQDNFQNYGGKKENLKLYVRRVFITDDFEDMMPKYLSFIKGLVDSDDLPLNVSRETLQQHKLLKVIKKKLVRKTLDMFKQLAAAEDKSDWDAFYQEYSTNIKLGVIEDHSNRTRLAKLLRFWSTHADDKQTSLEEYVERMKDKQETIYFVGGNSLDDVKRSPFVEKLKRKGYEVLFMIEPIDEYCLQSLPEFDSKKFQNVAKEGLTLTETDDQKEAREVQEKEFEPLLNWLKESALKERIDKAVLSDRLVDTPAALVASQYGWTGNMERIMSAQAYAKAQDPSQSYYATQKKTLELNGGHPVVKKLLKLHAGSDDTEATTIANLLMDMATIRSGYLLKDTASFGQGMERLLRSSLDIPIDEPVDGLDDLPEPEPVEEEIDGDAPATDDHEHDDL